MAFEFKNILSALRLTSATDPVTAENLKAADDKIAQLETDLTTAQASLTTVTGERDTANASLTTAQGKLTETEGKLTTAEEKVTTLEKWKKNNKAEDAREDDATNNLDDKDDEPKAAFEVAAAGQIARVKQRLGEK